MTSDAPYGGKRFVNEFIAPPQPKRHQTSYAVNIAPWVPTGSQEGTFQMPYVQAMPGQFYQSHPSLQLPLGVGLGALPGSFGALPGGASYLGMGAAAATPRYDAVPQELSIQLCDRGPQNRRLSDHRIYTTSGCKGPSDAIFQKMQERDGALVVDVVGEEAIPAAVRILATIAQMATTKLGRHVTVQPFGAKEPLAFNVAFSVLPTPPARPTSTMRVSSNTEPKKLGRYLLEHVVTNHNSVIMEATGKSAIIAAMMGIGFLRSRINWENLEDDLYCSVLPVERQETFESQQELSKNDKGEPLYPIKYFIALYPCSRVRDDKPRRVVHPTTASKVAAGAAGSAAAAKAGALTPVA